MANVIAIHSHSPRCETTIVTPEVAKAWMKKNTGNRQIREQHLDRLCRDHAAGNWRFNPQPIIFGSDGTLLDGQHRLAMVIRTGIPATMVVWFGVPPVAREVIDSGAMRSLGDVADINKRESAVTMSMICGNLKSHPCPTMIEKIAFHQRFLPEIRFAMEVMPGTRRAIKRASVAGAIARAACGHIPYETISTFARILVSGMPENGPADVTVIRLRDRLTSAKTHTGSASQAEAYGATSSALVAFYEGRSLSKIYCANTELFPLPVR